MTSDAQLIIRGVTVVDPRDGSLRAGQEVRIAGERIAPCYRSADSTRRGCLPSTYPTNGG